MKIMKEYLRGCLLFALSVAGCAVCGSVTAQRLPYNGSFESQADTAGWVFVEKGSSQQSGWRWGSAERRAGARSIYISPDAGVSAGYVRTALGYCVVAYKKFSGLQAGAYDLVFDCKAGGMADASGAMKDGLKVAWVPTSNGVPDAASMGYSFPAYVTMYPVIADDGREEFYNIPWENVQATVNVLPNESEYYLAFVWRTYGGGSESLAMGACIDNVQLGYRTADECAHRPTDIKVERPDDGSGYVVSWTGTADEYEFRYYRTNVEEEAKVTEVKGLTASSYTIPISSTPEGVYSLLVRSVCGGDTSVWSELSDVFIYDGSTHCLDFLNFYSEDVECTYGTFADPYMTKEVKNYGYESRNSVHTIHYRQDEYDIRTNNQLKTVPDGEIASVRIGNWMEAPAISSSITYRYTVTDGADVLKLSYAAVLQYAESHPEDMQTRIIAEILDAETDTLLSECTKSDFNAKGVDGDNVRNWHRIEYSELPPGTTSSQEPIMWCDWSVIGLNLEPYVGRTLKIRITMKPCGADFHFGYAYFVLDCDKGEISGVTCGEHPNRFVVPEGFVYEWYKTNDPDREVVGHDYFYDVDASDTADYSVDIIFPEDSSCYFTLRASALPREPVAAMDYEIGYEECASVVNLNNKSSIFGFWDGDTIDTGEPCSMYEWDMGEYGVSNEMSPVISVPTEGDTFNVTLTAATDKEMSCADTKSFTVRVPSIVIDTTFVTYSICDVASVTHDGEEYKETGRDVLHYTNGRTGCDSVVVLDIMKIETDTVPGADTVCTDRLPVMFHGKELTESGHYEYVEKSVNGCDSVVYTLDLLVNQTLVMTLEGESVDVCADEESFSIGYSVTEGVPTDYSLLYDAVAEEAGFVSVEMAATDGGTLQFAMPDSVRPGHYGAELVFYNSDCGDVSYPLTVEVLYPSWVIVQRWNDVLGLRNAEYNGGYEFSAYQWYKDGTPIEGKDDSVLYEEDGLDTGSEYRMLLTRADDGVSQFTCGIVPEAYDRDALEVFPTVTFSGETIVAKSSIAATGYLYGADGRLVRVYDVAAGENSLTLPDQAGVYVLYVRYADGTAETVKVAVTR